MHTQQTELASRTTGSRYLELDRLRGLAALSVVCFHMRIAVGMRPVWYVELFTAGHSAVILFFVLSGFVLSIPFWNKGRNDAYRNYLTRRFFRIYVPYAGAVAVAALGARLFAFSRLPLDGWFLRTWQTQVTFGLIAKHLVMAGGDELNTAFWSLRYEVQMSIVFPVLLLLLRMLRPALGLVLFTSIFLDAVYRLQGGATDTHHYLETLKYGSLFAVGAIIARSRDRLRNTWSRTQPLLRGQFAAFALFLYCGFGDYALSKVRIRAPEDFLIAIGSCGLILASMNVEAFRAALHHWIPVYLGRISYSMYLVHGTMLLALLNLLYYRVSRPALAVIYIASTFALSHLFCIGIEEPSLRFGKAIAGRWKGQAV